jgi:peroxiredoxin
MPNSLTGDYDAVLLIRVTKVNAILATLHQNGADEDTSPSFLHSSAIRVGDRRRIEHPEVAQFAEWLNVLLPTLESTSGIPEGRVSEVLEKAPPGASRALRVAYDDLQAARVEVFDTLPVRGTARVQLSAPSISLPPGSTSEVTVHVHVRAHYAADPGALALPEPIHGEVRVTFQVMPKRLQNYGSAQMILEVRPPQDDGKIQFLPAPGTGLSHFEVAQFAAPIRRAVREDFEPINVELPGDFQFLQFKELGGGEAIALPARLTPPFDVPAQALSTVANNFLDADFSVAISKEFVDGELQPTIQRLSAFRRDFPNWWTTYHVSVTSVKLEWRDGSIDLIIKVKATASRAPDYDVTIRQRLTLVLNPSFQRVSLGASNADLTISLSGLGSRFLGFVRDRIRNAIIPERDNVLPDAEELINEELNKARTRINDALKAFDDSARAEYGALSVTPDGLILHGGIFTKHRRPLVVEFEETRDGSAFTALKSWIPGGRIDRFEWSWIRNDRPWDLWGGESVVTGEAHRFILPKPAEIQGAGDICLRIEGVQIDQNGYEHPVSAGDSCSVSTPEVMWRMPAWSEPIMTPIWLPDSSPDTPLEEALAGHVNLLAHSRPGGDPSVNALVHFSDPEMSKPLDALGQALPRVRRRHEPLLVVVVLPSGTFKQRRRDVEVKLGSLGEAFRGRLILTEDETGAWKRAFDAVRVPSSFLMNSRGEFVWKQEGILNGDLLVAALDQHCTSGRPRSRRLGLTVRPGDRVPRALFTDDRGQVLALRKLRGHPVLLNFWQSWSAPCIRELRRLQSLQEKDRRVAPVIVAVNVGEKIETLSAVRRQHHFTYALVHDAEGFIARQFGVYCWPTTISIDSEGIVNKVKFGSYSAHPRSTAKQPTTSGGN